MVKAAAVQGKRPLTKRPAAGKLSQPVAKETDSKVAAAAKVKTAEFVHIIVIATSGMSIEHDTFPCTAHVADIKNWLTAQWNIPVLLQRLVHGDAVLRDSQKISAICRGLEGNALPLTLVSTVDQVLEHFKSAKSRKSKTADLQIIASLGDKAGVSALDMMIDVALNDEDDILRKHATSLLQGMHGDQTAHCLIALLDKPFPEGFRNSKMRQLVICKFTAALIENPLEREQVYTSISTASPAMHSNNEMATGLSQVEAIRILGPLMAEGDKRATEIIYESINNIHTHPEVRRVAILQLKHAKRGDSRALIVLCTLIVQQEKHDDLYYGVSTTAGPLLRGLVVKDTSLDVVDALWHRYLQEGSGGYSNHQCLQEAHGPYQPREPSQLAQSLAHLIVKYGDSRVFAKIADGCCSQQPSTRSRSWHVLQLCSPNLEWSMSAKLGAVAILVELLQFTDSIVYEYPYNNVNQCRSIVFEKLQQHESEALTAKLHDGVLSVQGLEVKMRSSSGMHLAPWPHDPYYSAS